MQSPEGLLWCESADTEAECLAIYQRAQCSLDLRNGPLLRGVLLTLPEGGQRLLLAVHHLVVDGVSWRILFEDLQLAYEQLHSGQPLRLPAKTSPFKAWSERLHALASEGGLSQEVEYWQARLQPMHSDLPGRRDVPAALMREAITVTTRLDPVLTRQLLQQAPAAYRTHINELLLAALSRVICRWTGRASLGLMLEGHGREDLFDELDLTRTVGWYTHKYPVSLTPGATLAQSIKAIKEELRTVPNKGLGFGALRYLGTDVDQQRLRSQSLPCVTFNYLGQFDASFDQAQGALFVPSSEAAGSERDSEAPLGNLLSLNGQVYGGVLNVGWTFSGAMFDSAVIQALADDYGQELQALVEHCLTPDVVGLTPADFPWPVSPRRNSTACRCRPEMCWTCTRCRRCSRACCTTAWKPARATCISTRPACRCRGWMSSVSLRPGIRCSSVTTSCAPVSGPPASWRSRCRSSAAKPPRRSTSWTGASVRSARMTWPS
ncbi:hypothetical protein EJJ20_25955 [Pseudomonas poae]|nr:hypothetical protein EJJ20_25955 [Pseudomonas poae]